MVNHDNEVVNSVLPNTLNKQTKLITKQYSFEDNNDVGENSNSVVEIILDSSSNERVNYKNDGTICIKLSKNVNSLDAVLKIVLDVRQTV